MKNHCYSRFATNVLISTVFASVAIGSPALAQCPASLPAGTNVKGKISRTFYRIPYAAGQNVKMVNDYFTHGGGMDMRSESDDPVIVAPADGTICSVRDNFNDCGCAGTTSAIGPCFNQIIMLHANGEITSLLHFKQYSVRNMFGVMDPNDLVGLFIPAGVPLGIEGDVGRTCGNESPPRWGTCITQAQAAGLTNCYRHLHWSTRRITTGELLEPMTCGVTGGIYVDDQTYTAQNCPNSSNCPATAAILGSAVFDGLGQTKLIQNDVSITASSFVVQNNASAVFHAKNFVRLLPGFHVGQGDAYFRAEIGDCNTTAANP